MAYIKTWHDGKHNTDKAAVNTKFLTILIQTTHQLVRIHHACEVLHQTP